MGGTIRWAVDLSNLHKDRRRREIA